MDVSSASKLKEFFKHMVVYGLGSVAQSAATFLFIPLYTEYWSVEEYGAFSYLTLLGVVFGGIFYLGIASALPRSYFDYDDEEDRKAVFSTSFYLLCLGAIAQITIGYFGAETLSVWLLDTPDYAEMVFLSITSSAVIFVSYLFYTYMRLKRHSGLVLTFSLGALAVSLGLVYYFVAILEEGILGAFKGQLYTQIGLLGLLLFRFARETLVMAFRVSEMQIQLMFGAGVVLSSFAGMTNQWIGQFFLEKYMSLNDVGIYALGAKLASLLNIILIMPMVQIWNPMMMEYRTSDTIKTLFSDVLFYYFLFGVYLLLATSLFVGDFLPLVTGSDDFLASAPIIPFIMFGILIFGSVNIFTAGLFYERKSFQMAIPHYVGAILNVVLCITLIPIYGLWAAVLTTTVVYCMAPFVVYSLAKKYFSFDIKWLRLFKLFALGAIILIINNYVVISEQMFRILFKTILLIAFILVSYQFIVDEDVKLKIKNFVKR